MSRSSEPSFAGVDRRGPQGGATGDPAPDPPLAGPRARRGRWIAVATWAYALLILAVLVLIRWVGEAWWGVTVLLFIPRWLYLVPVGLLATASALARCPAHWALQATTGLVVAGPLMGFSLPLARSVAPRPPGPTFRILCYNLGEGTIDVDRLFRMVERERIDLLCLQEQPLNQAELEARFARGWYHDRSCFVLSRYPIVADLPGLVGRSTTEGRVSGRLTRVRIRTPDAGELVVASVHMPTLRPGLNRFLEGDVGALKMHIDWWAGELGRVVGLLAETGPTPLLVAGDFNMPSDDSSMASLRSFLRFGFDEAGWGYGYTRPSRTPWFRIDHILASPHWSFTRCWVGPDLGSDHLPILAEAVLPPADRAR